MPKPNAASNIFLNRNMGYQQTTTKTAPKHHGMAWAKELAMPAIIELSAPTACLTHIPNEHMVGQ